MELKELAQKYTQEEKESLKILSDAFYKDAGYPNGKIINYQLFTAIFLALAISIPNLGLPEILENVLEGSENSSEIPANSHKKRKISYEDSLNLLEKSKISDKSNENEDEESDDCDENQSNLSEDLAKRNKKLDEYYDKLFNLEQSGFKSKNLKVRIEKKYAYNEEALKYRVQIQNVEYNYRGLGKGTPTFLQSREYVKKQKEQIDTYGIGTYKCPGCNTKWLKEENSKCIYCDNTNGIDYYVTFANFFQIIGDCDTFWEYVKTDKDLDDTLHDNGKEIKEYFQKQQHIRSQRTYNERIRLYGRKQYLAVVKRGDALEDPEYVEFNGKYKLNLIKGTFTVDLREAKNYKMEDIIEELSKLRFPFATKVYMPPRKIDISILIN